MFLSVQSAGYAMSSNWWKNKKRLVASNLQLTNRAINATSDTSTISEWRVGRCSMGRSVIDGIMMYGG